jgi:hypothetical protein
MHSLSARIRTGASPYAQCSPSSLEDHLDRSPASARWRQRGSSTIIGLVHRRMRVVLIRTKSGRVP